VALSFHIALAEPDAGRNVPNLVRLRLRPGDEESRGCQSGKDREQKDATLQSDTPLTNLTFEKYSWKCAARHRFSSSADISRRISIGTKGAPRIDAGGAYRRDEAAGRGHRYGEQDGGAPDGSIPRTDSGQQRFEGAACRPRQGRPE